jgi:hypothetical protein
MTCTVVCKAIGYIAGDTGIWKQPDSRERLAWRLVSIFVAGAAPTVRTGQTLTRLMPCSSANLHASFSASTLETPYPCDKHMVRCHARHQHAILPIRTRTGTGHFFMCVTVYVYIVVCYYYPVTGLVGSEVLDVGPGLLVQNVHAALQRPAGDCSRRRGQNHALHCPCLGTRPHDVQDSSDSRLDQFFLPSVTTTTTFERRSR